MMWQAQHGEQHANLVGRTAHNSQVLNTRTRALTIVCILSLLCLAACSTARSIPNGTIAGFVTLQGGPIALGDTNSSTRPAEAVVTASLVNGSGTSYTATSDNNGRFMLDLPPGEYLVTARCHPEDRGTPQRVTVNAGQTTRIEFTFYVP